MKRVLITAFGPYDEWDENASWLALQAMTRDLPAAVEATTRLYPVDFDATRERLESDLQTPYDAVLHVGQAAGAAAIRLEAIALNTRRDRDQPTDAHRQLEPDGPVAYRSAMPLTDWAGSLCAEGVPVDVSLHAGDYLCNATLYWSHYFAERAGRRHAAAFVHVPLDLSQTARLAKETPSMAAEVSGYALRRIVESLGVGAPSTTPLAQSKQTPSQQAPSQQPEAEKSV